MARVIIILIEEANFPIIICNGLRVVVSNISRVCFSLSPDIVDEVSPGTVNRTRPNSTATITRYILNISE